MRTLAIVLLAGAMGAATVVVGWWGVPVLAAGYALLTRHERAPRDSALAAVVSWGVLLAQLTRFSAFSNLLAQLGGIFPIPGPAVAALTLALAMLLAACSARVVIGLTGVRETK